MKTIFVYFFILLTFFFAGCASIKKKVNNISEDIFDKVAPSQDLPPRYYEPEVTSFVGEFKRAAEKNFVEINQEMYDRLRRIEWVDTIASDPEGTVLAACIRYSHTSSSALTGDVTVKWTVIEVLKSRVMAFTGDSRIRLREIIFHELFHCLLGKGHLPENVNGIMSASLAKTNRRAYGSEGYSWDDLVSEMFSAEFINMIPDVDN